jgi:hypothetical protein
VWQCPSAPSAWHNSSTGPRGSQAWCWAVSSGATALHKSSGDMLATGKSPFRQMGWRLSTFVNSVSQCTHEGMLYAKSQEWHTDEQTFLLCFFTQGWRGEGPTPVCRSLGGYDRLHTGAGPLLFSAHLLHDPGSFPHGTASRCHGLSRLLHSRHDRNTVITDLYLDSFFIPGTKKHKTKPKATTKERP